MVRHAQALDGVPAQAERSASRRAAATGLGWVSMLALDLVLHAGVLAPLYDWDSGFLLSPIEAFARIPAAYAAFLVLSGAVTWLLPRLGIRHPQEAALIAAAGGAIVWGALLLALWSITPADPALLAAWWLAQTVELGVAGYVIGHVLLGTRVRSVAWAIAGLVVIGVLVAVVLQSIGYAPAPVRIGG